MWPEALRTPEEQQYVICPACTASLIHVYSAHMHQDLGKDVGQERVKDMEEYE